MAQKQLEMDHYLVMSNLSLASIFARFSKYIQERTAFGTKDRLSLHSSTPKFFPAERDFDERSRRKVTQTGKWIR